MADSDREAIAKLNEIVDVLGSLNVARLRDALAPARVGGVNPLAGCDSLCECRGAMCGCNGVVSAREKFSFVSYPDFLVVREQRMRELREELEKLEAPKELRG